MQTYLKDIVEGIEEWCGDSADSSAVCIFHGIRGSRAYGTDIATSDTDTHGLYVYPSIMYAGLEVPKEQIQDERGDNIFYGLKRYFDLAMSANPNLIEILYSPDDCVLYKSDMFDLLVKHRSLFISKKCYNSFTGYAIAQIKKAKGKNKKVHGKDFSVTVMPFYLIN